MPEPSRRRFLKAAGVAAIPVAAPLAPADARAAAAPQAETDAPGGRAAQVNTQLARTGPLAGEKRVYSFLNEQEAPIIEAAVAVLIPSDENGPGAAEADVAGYIDKQLGGAWGAGERLYRSGPWHEGLPTQGYQLPYTPAELFRHALRGIHDDVQKRFQTTFDKMGPARQDAYLRSLHSGGKDPEGPSQLDGVPSKTFFDQLLAMTREGFFSDPVYGGNRGMVSWQLIGFPGAYANYYHLVDRHNLAFDRAPMSLAENGRGQVHLHPNLSAAAPHPGKK